MSDKVRNAAAGASDRKVVIERTYRATVEELWELWTTKEGLESWWGPAGFRTDVHAIEARSEQAVRDTLARDPWSETHLRVESIEAWTIRLDARAHPPIGGVGTP